MKKIYLIPGLATDERLFSNLHIDNADLRVLRWESLSKNDTMATYAERLSRQIDNSEPFYLLGVSFGGMCAVEISKIMQPEGLILISSAKGVDELPFFIKMFRFFPLHLMLDQMIIIALSKVVKYLFGRHSKGDRELLIDMLKKSPEKYITRAIHCIVTWNSHSNTCNHIKTLHLHGTSDRVIPIRNIKNKTAVKGATHFMVLNKTVQINTILNRELQCNFFVPDSKATNHEAL